MVGFVRSFLLLCAPPLAGVRRAAVHGRSAARFRGRARFRDRVRFRDRAGFRGMVLGSRKTIFRVLAIADFERQPLFQLLEGSSKIGKIKSSQIARFIRY